MKVTLLGYTNPVNSVIATRTCWDSENRMDSGESCVGEKDSKLIKRCIENHHESVIEHMVFTFDISGISRACLQELVRHRISSFSVKSTRYTLKKMKKMDDDGLAHQFISTGVSPVLDAISLDYVRSVIDFVTASKTPTDLWKHYLPETLKVDLVWTINARALRNFLNLRLDESAMWEIRGLAQKVFESIPAEDREVFFHEFQMPNNTEE